MSDLPELLPIPRVVDPNPRCHCGRPASFLLYPAVWRMVRSDAVPQRVCFAHLRKQPAPPVTIDDVMEGLL